MVHNEYGGFSGEEAVFYSAAALLRERGEEVTLFVRKSAELGEGLRGQARGFFSGIWSRTARRDFARALDEARPDVVQVQNLYPLISPSILAEIRTRGAPLVFTCHNYRLFCPTGLMLREDRPCTRCAGGEERWCVWHNCEGSLPKSLGYALRNHVARPRLLDFVDVFQVLSTFQRDRFMEWGIEPRRISIVPNFVDTAAYPEPVTSPSDGGYAAFAGRASPEKGVQVLLEAARRLPEVPFRIAGNASRMPGVKGKAPANVRFVGELARDEIGAFYAGARFTVAPSLWFEGMPMVVVEAMLSGRPVVASRIGGLIDLIEHGVTGLLVEPGDAEALAGAIDELWRDPSRAARLGWAARATTLERCDPARYYQRTMETFAQAAALRRAA